MRRLLRKWAKLWEYRREDRACAKYGHSDYPCWAESGAIGDKCGRCGRILWTWARGEELDPPVYQEPSRQRYW